MSITTQLDPLRRDGESDEQVVARLVEEVDMRELTLPDFVRERLRPLYLEQMKRARVHHEHGDASFRDEAWTRAEQTEDCARALLGRGPGEPSGLEEE